MKINAQNSQVRSLPVIRITLFIFAVIFSIGYLLSFLSTCDLDDYGYSFAWKDFEDLYMSHADLDENGIITHSEWQDFKLNWLKSNDLVMREGWYEVYRKNGDELKASEFVDIFTKKELAIPDL